MSLGTILIIILLFILLGGHFGAQWGNGPSGGLGLLLIIVIVLAVLGKI